MNDYPFAVRANQANRKLQDSQCIQHFPGIPELWKDADSGIAEVEDAKKRLAGLRNN